MFKNICYITTPEGMVKSIAMNGEQVWQRAHIYGVSWDKSNTQTMTRTDDAVGFSAAPGSGTTAGSSSFDSCYPWNGMAKVVDGNSTLVSIPKFWYKWTDGDALQLQIADKPVIGFYVSPMHADRGDGKGERDVVYIGRYQCSSDYTSISGVNPLRSISRATARSKIAALGDGYYQQDFAAFWTIRMLFLVEYATWDGQSVLQNTTDYSANADVLSGPTDSMAYHTGISADGASIQYRHIEDPWENCLEWVDGIRFTTSNVYVFNNPAEFSDTTGGVSIGSKLTEDGYISSWATPTVSGMEWALWPSAVSSSGYIGDYYYPESGAVLYTGGARKTYENHGPFFLYGDFAADSSSSAIGARLMKLP